MRFRLSSIAFSLLCAFTSPAYAGDVERLVLHLDYSMGDATGNRHGKNQEKTPVFISARTIEGKKNGQIEASGSVELHKLGQAIYADSLTYRQDSKDVTADGSVRVEQDNNVIQSPHLKLNLDTSIGDMNQPEFQFGDNHARGKAANLHLAGRADYVLSDVTYTTCPAQHDDWLLKVRELEIDSNNLLGVAHGARVEFMGVPILYTPWMDFPLSSQRKSGFLAPVFGNTVNGGTDLTLPYYWDIAPNLDATLAPRIISKRGILLNNEMRYLEPSYSGSMHLDILPGDRLSGNTRSLLAINHSQTFGGGVNGLVNYNRVSDDSYFRDLSDTVNITSQTNLLREGLLSYNGSWWNAATRVQSFQTLQDPSAPVIPPYNRLPQISLAGLRLIDKETVTFSGEFVDFRHPTLVNGQRLVLYPSVSYPLISHPAFYLTPKLGLHYTDYVMGANNTGGLSNASRLLPIFSLNSGMTMERDWNLAGKSFIQTLEPRAYYVNIPYRDQSRLPNFDSAQSTFSFAQMFTENRFLGSDRIGDANQVTVALTSRLLEPDTGMERLRVAVGERFSNTTPQVNLPATNTPPAQLASSLSTKSDVVLETSGQLTRAWTLDSNFQFTPSQSLTQQFNASARYQPESGKVLNLGYRFTRNSLRQIDLSTQWPLYGHWHGVARWNYSLQDGLILEALGGLEYNRDCWAVRLVAQRFVTATQQTSTGLFLQLELKDMVAVGSDPMALLRQNIFGYTKLSAPSLNQQEQVSH